MHLETPDTGVVEQEVHIASRSHDSSDCLVSRRVRDW